jgi:hypothetical protein
VTAPVATRADAPGRSYAGRTAALATQHGKDAIVAPPLAAVGLSVRTVVADTDRLGTFTRDIPRSLPPLGTAIAKARLAIADGTPLGLASEGSFGSHPGVPWATLDRELVVLVDDELDLFVVGSASSADVVIVSATVDVGTVDQVLERADLPRHALVVLPNEGLPRPIRKGLTEPDEVRRAVREAAAVSPDGLALVETDLRAHVCPSRRIVIAAAADDLARRLARSCPACGTPGWGPSGVVLGLLCDWCGGDVPVPRAETDACVACDHTRLRPVVEPAVRADAALSPRCTRERDARIVRHIRTAQEGGKSGNGSRSASVSLLGVGTARGVLHYWHAGAPRVVCRMKADELH